MLIVARDEYKELETYCENNFSEFQDNRFAIINGKLIVLDCYLDVRYDSYDQETKKHKDGFIDRCFVLIYDAQDIHYAGHLNEDIQKTDNLLIGYVFDNQDEAKQFFLKLIADTV